MLGHHQPSGGSRCSRASDHSASVVNMARLVDDLLNVGLVAQGRLSSMNNRSNLAEAVRRYIVGLVSKQPVERIVEVTLESVW